MLLKEPRKSKDHLAARKDLTTWGIHGQAWLGDNDKFYPAKLTLTKNNKAIFLSTLKNIKVLDGYSSNISRCIDL